MDHVEHELRDACGWLTSSGWRGRASRGAAGVVATAFWCGVVWSAGDSDAAQQAYIGPGAGIALLGSFFAVFTTFLSVAAYFLTLPVRMLWRLVRGGRVFRKAKAKRVVVLGLDGLEPTLVERFMDEGLLPNLAALREQGSYTRLETTYPPLSPVAWSSFSTGTNPGKHNIFDFISRNPQTYRPTQSSVQVREGRRSLRIGRFVLPLSRSRVDGLRRSQPFWKVLGKAGIFSAVLRVPITFPPDRFRGVQLSAMCVPDLRGTHGTFFYFTDHESTGATTAGDVGGEVMSVTRQGRCVRGHLLGPVNPLRVGRPEMTLRFRVDQRDDGSAVLRINRQRIALTPGQYTDWIDVSFRVLGPLKVRGQCRFMLKRFDERFEMYCTPVQINALRPAMSISHPRRYATYLARLLGRYATLGLAEDTWALSEQRIDEEQFLAQAYDIHGERERMYFDALKRVRRGMVVCVFDAPDRIQHMFWRYLDEQHPALRNGEREKHRDVIRDLYRRMDDLVGRTRAELDDDTLLFVMSDHGFKSFRRGIDLNRWLLENGYLALRDGATFPSATYLRDVDWSRTRAYALGLAGIFLNVKGREGAGTVPKSKARELAQEIADKLTGLRDDVTGDIGIHEAVPSHRAYSGPYLDAAPDIIIGYTDGYRVSWESAIGRCAESLFADNLKAWSGDHCIHPKLVPGVLFASRPLRNGHAAIVDIAPTTLDAFGIEKPSYMDGESLLCAG